MSQAAPQKINCPECGRSLVWMSRLAGSRVSCPCGRKFVMPFDPPPQDTYEIAGDSLLEEVPAAKAKPKLSRTLQYESRDPRDAVGGWRELLLNRSLLLPVIIVVLGIGFRFVLPMLGSSSGSARTGAGALLIVLGLVINVVTMLVGVGIVAKWTGADLGSPIVTAARLTAIAVVGSIVFAAVASLDKSDGMRGLLLGWHAVILLNWVMFATMFEFDTQESLFAVAVVGILQAISACALWHH